MADLAHYDRLQRAFDNLLQDLSTVWPKQDLDYVREEVGHGEYSDALENLIALGLRNGTSFDPGQAWQVETLAAAMGIENSPFLKQPQGVGKQAKNHETKTKWLDSLKQLTLTFIALSLIMSASAALGAAVEGFPTVHTIGTGPSSPIIPQIVSSSTFLLLLVGFAWWRVRPDWWQARREMDSLSG